MSFVRLLPPAGMTAECRMLPSWNSATFVVPPPRSSSTTPSSFSSDVSADSPAAIVSRTSSLTCIPDCTMQLLTFRNGVTAPVTMCTSTSSRTPDMPHGSGILHWSSTMWSWVSTWMTWRSEGIFSAVAASRARNTSSRVTPRPTSDAMATAPLLLTLSMCSPEIPTITAFTLAPASRSAARSASSIERAASSMLTTTPRLRPRDLLVPLPRIRSPSSAISPISTTVLVVPRSSAAIRSRAMFNSFCHYDLPPPDRLDTIGRTITWSLNRRSIRRVRMASASSRSTVLLNISIFLG